MGTRLLAAVVLLCGLGLFVLLRLTGGEHAASAAEELPLERAVAAARGASRGLRDPALVEALFEGGGEGGGGGERPAPAGRGRDPLFGGALFDHSPARPAPGEFDGPLARVRYDDGTLLFEAQQKQGPDGVWILHGAWTSWHENGQMQEQGEYKEQREHGRWQWWDENGQRIAVGTFIDGEREGPWTFWYEDGTKQMEANYAGGEGAGHWVLYHESGQHWAEGDYLAGEIAGYWTIWDEFGLVDPERSGYYEKGQKVSD